MLPVVVLRSISSVKLERRAYIPYMGLWAPYRSIWDCKIWVSWYQLCWE